MEANLQLVALLAGVLTPICSGAAVWGVMRYQLSDLKRKVERVLELSTKVETMDVRLRHLEEGLERMVRDRQEDSGSWMEWRERVNRTLGRIEAVLDRPRSG